MCPWPAASPTPRSSIPKAKAAGHGHIDVGLDYFGLCRCGGCVQRDAGGCCSEAECAARNGGIVGEVLVNEFIAHAVGVSCFSFRTVWGRGAGLSIRRRGAMRPRVKSLA